MCSSYVYTFTEQQVALMINFNLAEIHANFNLTEIHVCDFSCLLLLSVVLPGMIHQQVCKTTLFENWWIFRGWVWQHFAVFRNHIKILSNYYTVQTENPRSNLDKRENERGWPMKSGWQQWNQASTTPLNHVWSFWQSIYERGSACGLQLIDVSAQFPTQRQRFLHCSETLKAQGWALLTHFQVHLPPSITAHYRTRITRKSQNHGIN